MTTLAEIYSGLMAGSQAIAQIAKTTTVGSSANVPIATSGPTTQGSYRIVNVSGTYYYLPWSGI